MSSLPQKPPVDPRKVKKLLESHTAREAFQILAARIILANERVRDKTLPPSRTRVQSESHRTPVQMESRKLILTGKDLDDIKTGRYRRFQLPSEDEANYWLQQWRDGIKRGQDPTTIKNPGRRERPEVRE